MAITIKNFRHEYMYKLNWRWGRGLNEDLKMTLSREDVVKIFGVN